MNKKPLIVANWKATKTIKETQVWIKIAKADLEKINYADVVICPPFTSLQLTASQFENTNVKVGAQDISKFKKGAYTGEVTIEMLKGLATYCIVGHSERRRYFGESDNDVIEKVKLLIEREITPILCVSDLKQLDSYIERGRVIIENAEKIVFVHEPPSAISGGGAYRPESPQEADENSKRIGEKIGKKVITIYGGSINPANVGNFFSRENIQGGLVGQASGDPTTFLNIFSKLNKRV